MPQQARKIMESWNQETSIFITFILLSSCLLLTANSSMPDQIYRTLQPSLRIFSHDEATASSLASEGVADHVALDSDDRVFLAAHNRVRRHQGEPPFSWDPKLAFYARQYAEKRKNDCSLIHSNGPFGENIFWGGGNMWQAADAVRLWVREHRFYNRATMQCELGKMCGHYTQIVWRDSVRLGCARVQCMTGDTFVICSYDPPGNYIGQNPFDVYNNI